MCSRRLSGSSEKQKPVVFKVILIKFSSTPSTDGYKTFVNIQVARPIEGCKEFCESFVLIGFDSVLSDVFLKIALNNMK